MVSTPPPVHWLPLLQLPQVPQFFLQHVTFFLLDQPVGTWVFLVGTAVTNKNKVISFTNQFAFVVRFVLSDLSSTTVLNELLRLVFLSARCTALSFKLPT